MKKNFLILCCTVAATMLFAQTNPAITSWLQNTTLKGSYYVQGNGTPVSNNILANVQSVQYSSNWAYISTKGVPAYPTGPFLDGNPSQASSQNAIYKIPLHPVQNTGALSSTTPGNIGIFINGVSLFDFRDDVSWHNASGTLRGGPLGGMGDKVWNRDAVVAERSGFDCSKGHPAMGNYHHHQNPSAFNLDLVEVSGICDLYLADGLYTIDATQHAPLIGFAYDGFPIYGAYGYKNTDGSGGVVRMKSGYQLRNISVRTHDAAGSNVTDGPPVNSTYPLGYFREDYEYVAHSDPDYLDAHNGRFCVTPEYPEGIYCYFATVDENWNSAYPYVVGPTFYGVKTAAKVNTINESVTVYAPVSTTFDAESDHWNIAVFPTPSNEFIAVQSSGVTSEDIVLSLFAQDGKLVQQSAVKQGTTIAYLDTRTVYNGFYVLKATQGNSVLTKKVMVLHE